MDYANVVQSELDEKALERKLVALDDSTGNQICVVTVNSLNDEDISDVTYNTFKDWKIGNAKKDNGVLLLIALKERKVRIEVGRGLEGAIPDIVAKSIIRNDLVPAFKQQNYLGGINAAVNHLSQAAAGEYHEERQKKDNNSKGIGSATGFIIFIIIMIIVFIFRGRGNGGNGYRRGGSNAWMIPLLFNSVGGSNWGGGGSSNDSGGGGGFDFGGFGGGDTGGGGADGSW